MAVRRDPKGFPASLIVEEHAKHGQAKRLRQAGSGQSHKPACDARLKDHTDPNSQA